MSCHGNYFLTSNQGNNYVERFLAKTLCDMQLITPEQLRQCQEIQARYPRHLPLAFILIDKGYLTDQALQHLIRHNQEYFQYLAKYDMESLLGEELVQRGILTPEQLNEALEIQGEQPSYVPLVVILQEKGLLNEESILQIIKKQTRYFRSLVRKERPQRFGDICVQQKWISAAQLQEALKYQKRLHQKGLKVRLGKILINRAGLSKEQVFQALDMQGKKVYECYHCQKVFNVRYYSHKSSYTCPLCNHTLVAAPSSQTPAPPPAAPLPKGSREISKAKVVIEKALEESGILHDALPKKEEELWASSSWWRVRIDEILAKQQAQKQQQHQPAAAGPKSLRTLRAKTSQRWTSSQHRLPSVSRQWELLIMALALCLALVIFILILLWPTAPTQGLGSSWRRHPESGVALALGAPLSMPDLKLESTATVMS